MMYVDGGDINQVYANAGLRGYVDGPNPWMNAGLRGYYGNGMGFDFTDITGGFSLQTIALMGGAVLLLYLMTSKAGKSWDVGAQKLRARTLGVNAKQKIDRTVKGALGDLDNERFVDAKDKIDALEDIAR